MSFRHIAVRVASRRYVVGSRSDVLNEVEATFNNMGVYPPDLKEVGPDTYEGEIDTGYLLRVQEKGGSLKVSLNGYHVDDVMGAVDKYKEWKKTGGPGPTLDIQKIAEQELYGRTTPFSFDEDLPEEEQAGSSIWWYAFEAAGIVDWTPFTDFEEVEKALKSSPLFPNFSPREVGRFRENWEEYQRDYMPEHVKILKDAGLVGDELP